MAMNLPALTERRRDQGILSRVGQFFEAHPNLPDRMLALGTGLLAGQNWSQGLALGGQNVLAVQQDQRQQQYQHDALAQREAQSQAALKQAEARMLLDQVQHDERLAFDKEKATRPTGVAADAAALGIDLSTPEGVQQFQKFRQGLSRPPQVSVNFPQQPIFDEKQGLVFIPDKNEPSGLRAVAVPGGKADLEQRTSKEKAVAREKMMKTAGGVVIQDVGRAISAVEGSDWAAGPMVGQTKRLPGTPAYQLSKTLEGVRANIGFDKLQAMRDASPTGGALGQVSELELQLLQSAFGNLDITQDKQVVLDNLYRIHNQYLDTVHGTPEQIQSMVDRGEISAEEARPLMERRSLSFDAMGVPKSSTTPPEIQALLDKYAPVQKPAPNWDALASEAEAYAGQAKIEQLMRKKQALGASGNW